MRQFTIRSGVFSVIVVAIFGLVFWTGSAGRLEATPLDRPPRSPELVVSRSSVYVGSKFPGEAFQRTVSVWNRGRQTLTGTVSANPSWIRLVDPTSFAIAGGRQTTIGIIGNFPRRPGPFDGIVTVRSNGGNRTVRIHGTVRERAPAISVSPPTIDPLLVTPQKIDLGTILAGEGFQASLKLTNSTKRTLTGRISINGTLRLFLTESSFELGPKQSLSLGVFGHAPMRDGPFEGAVTILHSLGREDVRVEGVADDCMPDMPDWLEMGTHPPWISRAEWASLASQVQEAHLERYMETWQLWISKLIEQDRLCEADLEEYLILARFGFFRAFHKCFWDREYREGPSLQDDRLGSVAYLGRVLWTGNSNKLYPTTWYEVVYEGQVGWMRDQHLTRRLPFDMDTPMVGIPQDPEIAETLADGHGAQFIDIGNLVSMYQDKTGMPAETRPKANPRNNNLCGQFCVTALLGEAVNFRVMRLLGNMLNQEHKSTYEILLKDKKTGYEYLGQLLRAHGWDYQLYDGYFTTLLSSLEEQLSPNRMMIVLMGINGSTGCAVGDDGHWVVIEDVARGGDDGGWFRVYNPYWNREEMWTHGEFRKAWKGRALWVFPTNEEPLVDPGSTPEVPLQTPLADELPPPGLQDDQRASSETSEPCLACDGEPTMEEAAELDAKTIARLTVDETKGPDPLRFALQGPGAIEDEGPVIYCFNPTPDTIRCVVRTEGSTELDIPEEHGDGQSAVARQRASGDVDPDSQEIPWQRKRIDLETDVTVRGIRLQLSEVPEGYVIHQVWASPSSGPWRLVHEFQEPPAGEDFLEAHFAPALEKVRYLEVRTLGGRDLISDLEVF